jgi:beta-mannosidase
LNGILKLASPKTSFLFQNQKEIILLNLVLVDKKGNKIAESNYFF